MRTRRLLLLILVSYPDLANAWWRSASKDSKQQSSPPSQETAPPSSSKSDFFSSTDYDETLGVVGREARFLNKRNGRADADEHSSTKPWWKTALATLPKLRCHVQPSTTIKLKKSFRIFQRDVWIGADYHAQENALRLQTSWDDTMLGGTVLLTGRGELQFHKSWEIQPIPDLLTRLRLRTSIDYTGNASVFLGFGTDRIQAVHLPNGITLRQTFPIDKTGNHVKLEVKAKLVLPTPEIEFSTKTSRSVVGATDVELTVEELNLLLEY